MRIMSAERVIEDCWMMATGYAQILEKPDELRQFSLLRFGHFLLTREQLRAARPTEAFNTPTEIEGYLVTLKHHYNKLVKTNLNVRAQDKHLRPLINQMKANCRMDTITRIIKLREFLIQFNPDKLDDTAALAVWTWLSDDKVMKQWDCSNPEHQQISPKVTTLLVAISNKEAFEEAVKQVFPKTYETHTPAFIGKLWDALVNRKTLSA